MIFKWKIKSEAMCKLRLLTKCWSSENWMRYRCSCRVEIGWGLHDGTNSGLAGDAKVGKKWDGWMTQGWSANAMAVEGIREQKAGPENADGRWRVSGGTFCNEAWKNDGWWEHPKAISFFQELKDLTRLHCSLLMQFANSVEFREQSSSSSEAIRLMIHRLVLLMVQDLGGVLKR